MRQGYNHPRWPAAPTICLGALVYGANNRYVAARPAWFVGAAWDGIDQTDRFLRDGLWENGYQNDMYSDLIDAMEAGDRIVIKSYFNQKDRPGLPFDGRGQNVTGMVIKVTGVISEHLPRMDGRRRVKVDWTRVIPGRDWYFSTSLPRLYAKFRGGNGCHHVGTPPLVAGVGGFSTIRPQR